MKLLPRISPCLSASSCPSRAKSQFGWASVLPLTLRTIKKRKRMATALGFGNKIWKFVRSIAELDWTGLVDGHVRTMCGYSIRHAIIICRTFKLFTFKLRPLKTNPKADNNKKEGRRGLLRTIMFFEAKQNVVNGFVRGSGKTRQWQSSRILFLGGGNTKKKKNKKFTPN